MKKIVLAAVAASLIAGSANAGGWDAWDQFWGTDLPGFFQPILEVVNPPLFEIDLVVKAVK